MPSFNVEEVKSRLAELYRYVCAQPIARKIVASHFSKREAKSLTNAVGAISPNFVAKVSAKRGLTIERTVLELALEAQFINHGEYKKLRRAVSDPIAGDAFGDGALEEPTPTDKPHWDAQAGKLFLGDELLGEFRVGSIRTKPFVIFDAFQAADWDAFIPDPFQGKSAEKGLSGTVNYVNGRLKRIQLHVRRGASELWWELKSK